MNKFIGLLTAMMASVSLTPAIAGQVEVLHWWTSNSEVQSARVLQQYIEAQGHSWKNFAIAGGGQSAMTVLISRTVAGTPPTAAQLKGPSIAEWGKLGFLLDLDSLAQQGQWEHVLPSKVIDLMRYQDHFVAVPVNIHQVNALWLNASLLQRVNGKPPETLEELFQLAEKLKSQGILPFAHGNQPWQNITLFDSIALAILGPDEYLKAFVELAPESLASPLMQEAFMQLRRLKSYMDDQMTGRDWNQATHMLINGQAAMQFSGDWINGELLSAQQRPGVDYFCSPAPGTQSWFSFNVDSFVFFKLRGRMRPQDIHAQEALAKTLLDKDFQKDFNQIKGSIPVRMDLDTRHFDACAQSSIQQFKASEKAGNLVPSISHGNAANSEISQAIEELVHQFFNDDQMTPKQAAQRLAKVVQAAK